MRCTSSTRKSCNSIRPLDTPERAQWLEVAQFPTEDRAKRFREDFMSLVGADELGHITGPALARVIADDLEMDSRWQIMDKTALEKLKAGKWGVVHTVGDWQPWTGDRTPARSLELLDL